MALGFLCGLAGAFLGAIVGIVAAFFAVAAEADSNDFANGLALMCLTPIGLVFGAIIGIVLALKLRRYARENWCIKAARRKTALIVAGSVLAVPALVAGLVWGHHQLRKPPPDQQLLNNFNCHRATFDILARMTQADKGLMRVDYGWTVPAIHRQLVFPPRESASIGICLTASSVIAALMPIKTTAQNFSIGDMAPRFQTMKIKDTLT